MRETWYVLEDDSAADPSEVTADESGKLVHKDGKVVKMRSDDVPMSRGVDVDPDRKTAVKEDPKREVVAEKPKSVGDNREMKASVAKKYETR